MADDHDDGEGADLDRAITAYKQHARSKPHGSMRNEMAQLVHAGVAGAWFEEAWEAAEAQGAVRWAYVRAVLEHWRDHGRDCACRRRGGGATTAVAEEVWDGTWTDDELVRLAQQ